MKDQLTQELLTYMGKRLVEQDIELAEKQSTIEAQRDNIKAKENFINCQLNDICDLHEALAIERQKIASPVISPEKQQGLPILICQTVINGKKASAARPSIVLHITTQLFV